MHWQTKIRARYLFNNLNKKKKAFCMGSQVLQLPENRMTNLHCYTSCSDSQRIRGVQSVIAQNLKSSIYSRQKASEITTRYSHFNIPNKNEQQHDKYII